MPLDYWKQRFQDADPNRYHQFRNKDPEKKVTIDVYQLQKPQELPNENYLFLYEESSDHKWILQSP